MHYRASTKEFKKQIHGSAKESSRSIVQAKSERYQHMNQSLLEYCEKNDIAIESSCRGGFCGQCRVKVCGEVIYQQEPLGFCADDEVLACCVDMTTSNIKKINSRTV